MESMYDLKFKEKNVGYLLYISYNFFENKKINM